MRSAVLASAIALAALESFAAKPVALDWHNGGRLFVLSKPGEIGVYDVEHRRRLKTIAIDSKIRPADIVSAKIFSTETLFVSGFYGRQSVVLQYTPEGVLLNQFNTPDLAAGMDIDPNAKILYVASPFSRAIYAINLNGKDRSAHLLSFVGLARTLGPVIFDAPRQRLLVGDTQSGSLYAVDCRKGLYEMLANNLGGPVSLAFDKAFSTLYVADYVNGKIHVLHFPPVRSTRASETALHDLSAVSLAPGDDNVFIADEERGVFLFSTKTGAKSSISSW